MTPSKYVLLITAFFCGYAAWASDDSELYETPSLSLKFNFGNPHVSKWFPKYGGSFDVEYTIGRYFSVAGDLAINSAWIDSALNPHKDPWGPATTASLAFAPKFRIPFKIQSTELIPYISWHAGIGVNYIDQSFASSFLLSTRIGAKLFFTKKWGVLAEYGFQMDMRPSQPTYVIFSHISSARIVYRI